MSNRCVKTLNIFQRLSSSIVYTTESFFYKLGIKIGRKPIKTILLCWLFVILSTIGFVRFHQEKNPMKLWVPLDTSFTRDSEWLMKTLQMGFRTQVLLVKADNILTPNVLQQLIKVHYRVERLKTSNNISWSDVCFKIPKPEVELVKLLESSSNILNKLEDPSLSFQPVLYCTMVEMLQSECYVRSILELWDFNQTKINLLTQDEIINSINNYDITSLFGRLKDFKELLGGIQRNSTGHIIGAEVLQNAWMVNVNFSAVDMDKVGNLAGTADWATEDSLDWENQFLHQMAYPSNILDFKYYYSAARSFGDISGATMFQDMDKLIFGVFIMIVYVQIVLAKFNWVEIRVILGFTGLLTIGMAFLAGCGICSLLGVYYGPVHTSLPFLLMGLGIDDMLVILACWEEINKEHRNENLPERIGLMLKHAGVSITVTSITDVVAFIIGSSTILPCLQSFCIYAGVCVLMIFIFAVTFFTACVTLDQRRLEDNRNGILFCIKYEDYKPNSCSQINLTNKVLYFVYDKIIFTKLGKILVIIFTVVNLGFSIESTLKLQKGFDPLWFIPKNTYLNDFLQIRSEYFPDQGYEGGIFIGAVNYTHEFQNIKNMVDELKQMTNITKNIYSWIEPFRNFVLINFNSDLYNEILNDELFNLYLSKFLFSTRNAQYQANFRFETPLECGVPAPKIILSNIEFTFHRFTNVDVYVPIMHQVRNIATKANLTTGEKFATVWSKVFATWITDELIDVEVIRNLELALICVMACTILLIVDWQICFWIFICILLTMVNVCGFMQRWGLTIDLVSCIGLELAIGLCVDYATHIGHTFLTIQSGNREERALKTVGSIGAAVLYGGISTLIGVFMLSQSDAYTFQAFFKIFVLVIFYGLFHGIVFLPVILSWIGPPPYRIHSSLPQCDTELT